MIILFSGGLESTSLIAFAIENDIKNIKLLYIKSGYRWEDAEIYHAKKIALFYQKRYKELDITFDILNLDTSFNLKHTTNIQNAKDNVLPIRNLFLLTNASMYALKNNEHKLLIGIQHSIEYPDTSKEYISSIENLIRIGSGRDDFTIFMPFYDLDKDSIVKKYHKNIPINHIFSCTEPIGNDMCNNCFKCKKLNKIKENLK